MLPTLLEVNARLFSFLSYFQNLDMDFYFFQYVFAILFLQFLALTEAAVAPLSSFSFSSSSPCYNNCSARFQCGNVNGIGYPFWGNNRASYCGKPDLQLSCLQGNITEIKINSKAYRVLDVVQQNRTLRIARTDFWDDACPSARQNTSLNSTTPRNFSLFYERPVSAAGTDPTLFTCVDAARINESYFESGQLEACKVGIQIPARQSVSNVALWEVFRKGFDVLYYDAKEFSCNSCVGSGGECGYDSVNRQSVCFARDDQSNCIFAAAAAPQRPNGTAAPPPGPSGGNAKVKIGIVASVVGTLVIAAAGIVTFYCLRKKKTKNSKNLETFLSGLAPKRFKYSDLRKMTDGFQDKLGQGGYGSVYKGKLPDGRMVAVKLLNEAKGNGEDFVNEVASISRTSHVNVVALLGFCAEGSKRALVYEFVPNGSLEKFIHVENPQLGWETLYNIAVGIARGLEYLHRGCYTRILHFDIKPHNILLDQDFSPKISDFGLAKLSDRKESTVSMIRARGTAGYIAPEVVSRKFGVSYKADVYSYGMMVLEMVGGRKNLDPEVTNPSEIYFPSWIYKRLNLNADLELHEVTNAEEEEIARKMIIVGLCCIQTCPSDRPAMSGVLGMLEGKLEALQIPPKLFEPLRASHEEQDSSPTTISIS